jgi:hypothetical protein
MGKVIKFPLSDASSLSVAPRMPQQAAVNRARESSVLAKGIWGLAVLCWPLIRWVLALDCVFQGLRALWYWHTPGTYAGWVFILHFALLTALTYYVSCYRPK